MTRDASTLLAVAASALIFAGTAGAANPIAVASHYAGQPITLVRGADGAYGKASGARIKLHDSLYDSLTDARVFQPGRHRFVTAGYTTDADDWDAIALHVLIHEAIHIRYPDAPEGAADCAAVYLVPDALERFYGYKVGTARATRLWWFRGTYPLDCGWFDGRALRRPPVEVLA